MVRLACTKCDRRRQYRQSTPIERYAPDKNVETFRARTSPEGRPKIGRQQDHGPVRRLLSRPDRLNPQGQINRLMR
jgi:hypothetical protein